jgi:hypothetical protein
MRGKHQNNKNLAMALPGKVVVRVSQGSFPLLSLGNNQERNTHSNKVHSLSFILAPIADTARTTAAHNTSEEISLSLFIINAGKAKRCSLRKERNEAFGRAYQRSPAASRGRSLGHAERTISVGASRVASRKDDGILFGQYHHHKAVPVHCY